MPKHAFQWILCALLILFVAGCGGTTSPGDGGGGSTPSVGDPNTPSSGVNVSDVDLTVTRNTVPVGESVSVKAIVEGMVNGDAGRIASIPVHFTTTSGHLSSTTATTNSNGVAEVTLIAPTTPGQAQIRATAGGTTNIVTTTVEFAAGPTTDIELRATPTTLAFNRESTLSLQATDRYGNPAANRRIHLAINPNNSGGTLSTFSVVTDEHGRASATYTAGNAPGMDVVKATSNGVTSTVDITVDPEAAVLNSLSLDAGSATLVANGTAHTFIRATVTDIQDRPVGGVTVTFNTSAGTLNKITDVTNAAGHAQVKLTSETNLITARVRAAVGGLHQVVDVEFVPGEVALANSAITVNPSTLPADGFSKAIVTVTLADADANPVDTQITLQTSAGSITSENPTKTDLGRATFAVKSPNSPMDGQVWVLEYPALSAPIQFGGPTPGTPASIQVRAEPQHIFVAGVGKESQSTITLTISDTGGNPIDESQYSNPQLNNVRVTLTTQPGGGEFIAGTNAGGERVTSRGSGFIELRSTNGRVNFILQSGTLPGVVEIKVEVLKFGRSNFSDPGNVATTASVPRVVIASGPPHTLVLTSPIEDAIINNKDGTYSLKGTVIATDRYGNAVPDGTSISLGVMDSVIVGGTGQIQNGSPTLRATNFTQGTNFTSTIVRNHTARGIQDNDRIVIIDAKPEDKSRFVDGSSLGSANTLDANAPYKNHYSNSIHFAVGASLLGSQIFGMAQNGTLIKGTGKTRNGIVHFRLRYPANRSTILLGCLGNDPRYAGQTADLYVIASSNDTSATTVNNSDFCFSAVAPVELAATPRTVEGDATITLELTDKNSIPLPYVDVSASTITSPTTVIGGPDSQFDLTVNVQSTDINGHATAHIDVNCNDGARCEAGDSAIVTFHALDADVEVTVKIP